MGFVSLTLRIQLQRFGQNNSSNDVGRRGPIALSDDDLVGATGIEWEDIEAQLHGDNHGEDQEEEMDDMTSRPLKPMSRQDRYLYDDEDEEGEEMSSNVNVNRPYADDEGEDDGDVNHEGTNSEAALREGESTESQKDSLFKLEDADSD
ncbi:hypothetical protein BGZ80_000189 [Entomortierella chlamydospora]|uniref:Uncharacterized protein n=1 Tax=Entomortierella chlamydospora TaxID=101097 RepID=A0A9P6SYN0_9FUNG|nr:hypothetical protein BGZ80_000189 [Entomortierella chlamydospora]